MGKTVRRKNAAFRPLSIETNRVLISDGYNRTPELTLTRQANIDGVKQFTFVAMRAREPWLIKGAAGSAQVDAGLNSRTSLLKDLRRMLEQACNGRAGASDTIRCRGVADTPDDADDVGGGR